MNAEINMLFNPDTNEDAVVDVLKKYKFVKIGEGFHAHVFADKGIVLKIFPPLHVGGPEDLQFIRRNPLLRYINRVTSRWQGIKTVRWIRRKAKYVLSIWRGNNNVETKQYSSELSIRGYELCVRRGLMHNLPTRIIPNCISQLSFEKINGRLRPYLEKPDRIVMQQRFDDKDLLINVLKTYAEKNNELSCQKLIQAAVYYQVSLWRKGITDTDMSFNIFENLIVLPDGIMQLHDANDITDSLPGAKWYVREKDKDIKEILHALKDGYNISRLSGRSGIAETACKLYSILPKSSRITLVMFFLDLSSRILSEEVLVANWEKVPRN